MGIYHPINVINGNVAREIWRCSSDFAMEVKDSGKHTKNYGKIHHFQWVNPLFLWQFSIAMLVYQRVSCLWVSLRMSIRWALDGPEMAQIVVKSIYSPELAG